MDFVEFVEQYKLRTAKRMIDFEAAIKDAHRRMEQAGRQQQMVRELNLRRPVTDLPRGVYRAPKRGGRVQGILQHGGMGDTPGDNLSGDQHPFGPYPQDQQPHQYPHGQPGERDDGWPPRS